MKDFNLLNSDYKAKVNKCKTDYIHMKSDYKTITNYRKKD